MIKTISHLLVISIILLSNLYGDSVKLSLTDSDEEKQFIDNLNALKAQFSIKKSYPKIIYKADDYIALKKIDDINSSNSSKRELSYTPQQYLSLKEIIYPMPNDYAKTYLKLKRIDSGVVSKIVKIYINKKKQRMSVYLNDKRLYTFKVSTARSGYWTPRGTFRPYSLERMHYSRKYYNSPMPYSIFFKGGYAIHGTHSISRLGRPASHGCVRLHPKNAKRLYSLIRRYGKRNTKIVIY